MVPIDDAGGTGAPADGFNAGTLVGKRYTDEGETIELLVTKPGDGSLSIGDVAAQRQGRQAASVLRLGGSYMTRRDDHRDGE